MDAFINLRVNQFIKVLGLDPYKTPEKNTKNYLKKDRKKLIF